MTGGPPRFHLYFSPTSSPWLIETALNLVERWFRELTDKAIRRGVFHGVNEPIIAIEDYLRVNSDNPKPFMWTATADESPSSKWKVNNETRH